MAQPNNEVLKQQPEVLEIDEMIRQLEAMRAKHGERKSEFPKMDMEAEQLTEKNESVFDKTWEVIKKAFKFIAVEVPKWIGHQVVDHPYRTLMIALSAFTGYKAYNLYKGVSKFLSPLSSALAALKEGGQKITSSLLPETKSIDPAQAGFFDKLSDAFSAGGVKNFLKNPLDVGVGNLKNLAGL